MGRLYYGSCYGKLVASRMDRKILVTPLHGDYDGGASGYVIEMEGCKGTLVITGQVGGLVTFIGLKPIVMPDNGSGVHVHLTPKERKAEAARQIVWRFLHAWSATQGSDAE